MKKQIVLGLVGVLMLTSLTGCSNSEMSELNNIEAAQTESEVSTVVNLASNEQETLIYEQVSDRTLLDLTLLDACDDTYISQIEQFMNQVNDQITGAVNTENGVISEDLVNYILFEMEKTPYHWSRTEMSIKGMDSNSRNVIVDVTYTTCGGGKALKGDSTITKGCDNYDQLISVRANRWNNYLLSKYDSYGNVINSPTWRQLYNDFKKAYGNPKTIMEEQTIVTPAKEVQKNGKIRTFKCLQDSPEEKVNGTMTFRFILTPKFKMGINLGWSCEHMYMTNYKIDKDPTEGKEVYTAEGSESVVTNLDKLMNSYYKCIEESNHYGLYKLVEGYEKWDKYMSDYFDYTYRKNCNYTITLFNISGKSVDFGVTLSRKVRAKNTKMTLPIYTERYHYQAELIGDSFKITNETLLSSTLEGEPAITTETAETTGFSNGVNISTEDRQALEKVIADFGVVHMSGDYKGKAFSDVVDLSISGPTLTEMRNKLEESKGKQKSVYITSYLQGSTNYASILCKELTQKEDNSIIERDVTYTFLFKNDKWYISDWRISSENILNTQTLNTKNALCVCTPKECTEFNSQINTGENGKTDDVPEDEQTVNNSSGVEKNYTFEATQPRAK